ncbi:hypothetical protein NQZ68_037132 [Dissostichus eleginoides]|nr:hypothetical protein NQZ68_037132 [Dissostichus eleginoides]
MADGSCGLVAAEDKHGLASRLNRGGGVFLVRGRTAVEWTDERYGGGMFVEGARVTTTASRKDNHSHTELGFPRGRGGRRGGERKEGRDRWRKKEGSEHVFVTGGCVRHRLTVLFKLKEEIDAARRQK